MTAQRRPSPRKETDQETGEGTDSETIADWGELRLLRWVRRAFEKQTGASGASFPLTIGDDAAHLRLRGRRDLIVTTDALVENVHFKHEWITPRELGAKALVANLSDLAAMAAMPVACFLSLGVPPGTRVRDIKDFFLGLRHAARRWECPLLGGDLVRAPVWTINITALGRPAVKRRVVRRSSARAGQTLYVTGWPGESAAGLEALRQGNLDQKRLIARHTRPTPRLPEAALLARVCSDLALIDVSDGVANDSAHLARESGVGIEIEIDIENLPVSPAMKKYAASIGVDPVDWVLDGGEDYELLFATKADGDKIAGKFRRAGLRTRVRAIGRVVEGKGVRLVDAQGRAVKRPTRSFKHFG